MIPRTCTGDNYPVTPFFSTHESLTLKKFEVLPCHIILIEESYDDIAKQMHTIHI